MKSSVQPARLAYLGSDIPVLSATFIYREILELERRGYSLRTYSLRRIPIAKLSAEAVSLAERVDYLLPIRIVDLVAAHLRFLVLRPLRYVQTIGKMLLPHHRSHKDRFRSLMHFGEGVVLARRMEADGITHIHAQYASQPTSVARVIHLLTGLPYSFSAHAHDIWEDRLLLREKLREVKFAVCCSAHGRSELIRQGDAADAAKVHVVYHGLDVQRFVPPPGGGHVRNAPLILAVGRLDAMKGFADLIAACHLLRQEGVAFACRIIGAGEERERLLALITEYHLEGVVNLPGAVKQEQILSHYHEAALFVLPCVKTGTNRYDGVPNVLVEAMATGLPVVSTTISGIPELVTSGADGFLVPPHAPAELAARMKQLLQDAALRQRLGLAARATVCARFDNHRCIEPLLELLRRECGVQPARLPESRA